MHAETLLIRTREAVQAALTRTTGAGLARVLRCDKSRTSRAKKSLRQLHGEEFTRLLAFDDELREDLVELLTARDELVTGTPEEEVHALLRPAAQVTDHILERLEDDDLNNQELRATAEEFEQVAKIARRGAAACRGRLKTLRRSYGSR